MDKKDKINNSNKLIAQNKKASFNYFLSDFMECGIALVGTEIKSIRTKGCSLIDSYVIIRNNEAIVINMHIAPYEQGNIFNHEPLRSRKLLLHKRQIKFFSDKTSKEGYSIIPTKVYFSKGRVKLQIALGKGKKLYDKRETIKKRDIERKIKENY